MYRLNLPMYIYLHMRIINMPILFESFHTRVDAGREFEETYLIY